MTRRVLVGCRLSRDTDSSTSIERQQEQGQLWTRMQGAAEVVAETVDTDVSGGVSPFDRPKLGPYFREPLVDTWDTLLTAKLDRLTRSVADFSLLMEWCQDHGKTIVSIAESFDLSTPAGRMVASIMAVFAEFERARASERRAETTVKLRNGARWNGGAVPFGYRAEQRPDGWDLVPDPVTAAIVRRMADWAIAGISAAEIARRLNAEKIPTSQAVFQRKSEKRKKQPTTTWQQSNVSRVLRSESLRGYVIQSRPTQTEKRLMDQRNENEKEKAKQEGREPRLEKFEPITITNGDGLPVQREPILKDDIWYRLQAALDKRSVNQAAGRIDAHPLLGVGRCENCSGLLYALRPKSSKWHYYVCSNRQKNTMVKGHKICQARSIPMAKLDAAVIELMTGEASPFRKIPWQRKKITARIDHTAEIEVIQGQLADLEAAFTNGAMGAEQVGRLSEPLIRKRDRLAAENQPGTADYEDTDLTVAEVFLAANTDQRRQMMLDMEIVIDARMDGRRLVAQLDSFGVVIAQLDENGQAFHPQLQPKRTSAEEKRAIQQLRAELQQARGT